MSYHVNIEGASSIILNDTHQSAPHSFARYKAKWMHARTHLGHRHRDANRIGDALFLGTLTLLGILIIFLLLLCLDIRNREHQSDPSQHHKLISFRYTLHNNSKYARLIAKFARNGNFVLTRHICDLCEPRSISARSPTRDNDDKRLEGLTVHTLCSRKAFKKSGSAGNSLAACFSNWISVSSLFESPTSARHSQGHH